MLPSLLHVTYFPNITHFAVMVQSDAFWFEVSDNYQKQCFRNRTEIYGANGKLALTVPVSYTQNNRQLYKDVKIANNNNWQQLHLKSLQSAYSMSPFFEFYIDDLMPIFEKRFDFIMDLNLQCFELLNESLQLDLKPQFTEKFDQNPKGMRDFRSMVQRNYSMNDLNSYVQVFTEKHGFMSNLSILDLLFNQGPSSSLYLNTLKINSNA